MSSQNMTGHWSGTFWYPDNIGPPTPFEAQIDDNDGHLSGAIIEPSAVDGETLKASLFGTRHGSSCDFIKTYSSAAPEGYDQPVDYVGGIASDGLAITGVWSLLDLDGKFEMFRDTSVQEVVFLSQQEEATTIVD